MATNIEYDTDSYDGECQHEMGIFLSNAYYSASKSSEVIDDHLGGASKGKEGKENDCLRHRSMLKFLKHAWEGFKTPGTSSGCSYKTEPDLRRSTWDSCITYNDFDSVEYEEDDYIVSTSALVPFATPVDDTKRTDCLRACGTCSTPMVDLVVNVVEPATVENVAVDPRVVAAPPFDVYATERLCLDFGFNVLDKSTRRRCEKDGKLVDPVGSMSATESSFAKECHQLLGRGIPRDSLCGSTQTLVAGIRLHANSLDAEMKYECVYFALAMPNYAYRAFRCSHKKVAGTCCKEFLTWTRLIRRERLKCLYSVPAAVAHARVKFMRQHERHIGWDEEVLFHGISGKADGPGDSERNLTVICARVVPICMRYSTMSLLLSNSRRNFIVHSCPSVTECSVNADRSARRYNAGNRRK